MHHPRPTDKVSFTPEPYPMDVGVPVVEDEVMMHLEELRTNSFCFEDRDDWGSAC